MPTDVSIFTARRPIVRQVLLQHPMKTLPLQSFFPTFSLAPTFAAASGAIDREFPRQIWIPQYPHLSSDKRDSLLATPFSCSRVSPFQTEGAKSPSCSAIFLSNPPGADPSLIRRLVPPSPLISVPPLCFMRHCLCAIISPALVFSVHWPATTSQFGPFYPEFVRTSSTRNYFFPLIG